MDIDRHTMPSYFSACISSTCPKREHCLHAWAWQHRDPKSWLVDVINPDYTSEDGNCSYYCDDQPQRYARGFENFQKRMYPDQYKSFMYACIARFGRNPYFMRRRGETPLPPSEQAFIRQVLKRVGAPDDLEFDAYEDRINWDGK